MLHGKTLAVVVPAYNEETLIETVITTIPDIVDHIIVIDDCSKDATVRRIEQLREQLGERLHLISHQSNRGVGGAIATGYKYCRDRAFDVTVVMAVTRRWIPTICQLSTGSCKRETVEPRFDWPIRESRITQRTASES